MYPFCIFSSNTIKFQKIFPEKSFPRQVIKKQLFYFIDWLLFNFVLRRFSVEVPVWDHMFASYMERNIFEFVFSDVYSNQPAICRMLNVLFQNVNILQCFDRSTTLTIPWAMQNIIRNIVSGFVVFSLLRFLYPPNLSQDCQRLISHEDCLHHAVTWLGLEFQSCVWKAFPSASDLVDAISLGGCTSIEQTFSISAGIAIAFVACIVIGVLSPVLNMLSIYVDMFHESRHQVAVETRCGFADIYIFLARPPVL